MVVATDRQDRSMEIVVADRQDRSMRTAAVAAMRQDRQMIVHQFRQDRNQESAYLRKAVAAKADRQLK